ncbi:hypothetical protein NL676_038901 [Syzygium grande]|nr:hypothetical protein NL676_038901 [Syzygium grande]
MEENSRTCPNGKDIRGGLFLVRSSCAPPIHRESYQHRPPSGGLPSHPDALRSMSDDHQLVLWIPCSTFVEDSSNCELQRAIDNTFTDSWSKTGSRRAPILAVLRSIRSEFSGFSLLPNQVAYKL